MYVCRKVKQNITGTSTTRGNQCCHMCTRECEYLAGLKRLIYTFRFSGSIKRKHHLKSTGSNHHSDSRKEYVVT